MSKYTVSVLFLFAVIFVQAFLFPAASAAEWDYRAMNGIMATCLEYDQFHERILVGTYEGFHYYDVAGDTWYEHDEEGWIGREVHAIAAHETVSQRVITGRVNAWFKGYIEYSDVPDENGVYVYSSNGGKVNGLARDPSNPDLYYACTWSDLVPGEIVRSTNGGVSWICLSGTLQYAYTSIAVDVDGVIYAGGSDQITRSLNGGDTWESASSGLPSEYGVYCLAVNPGIPGQLYASNDLGLYRSENGGESWALVSDLSCREVAWGYGWAILPDSQRGEREGTAPIGLATWDNRVLVSFDDGDSWNDETGDLPGTPIDLAFSTADWNLYVATANTGVYTTPFFDPGDVPLDDFAEVPALNGSNPFRPGSSIDFYLPREGWARLDVIDLTGRYVATLMDGFFSAGTHEIKWLGETVPAGVYFSRLSTTAGVSVRKFVITGR